MKFLICGLFIFYLTVHVTHGDDKPANQKKLHTSVPKDVKGKRDAPVVDYYPSGKQYQQVGAPHAAYGVPQVQNQYLPPQQHQSQHHYSQSIPQTTYGVPSIKIQQPQSTYGPPSSSGIKYSTPQVLHAAQDYSYLSHQQPQQLHYHYPQTNYVEQSHGGHGASYIYDNSGSDLQQTLTKYFGGHNSLIGGYSDSYSNLGVSHGPTYSGSYKANLGGHGPENYKLKVSPIVYESVASPAHGNDYSSHHNFASSSYELPLSQTHSSYAPFMSYAPSMSYGAPAHTAQVQSHRYTSNIPSYAHGIKGLSHYSTANIEAPAPQYKLPSSTYGAPFIPGKPISLGGGKHNLHESTLHTSYIGTHPKVSFKPSTFIGLSSTDLPGESHYQHQYQQLAQEYGPPKQLYSAPAPTKGYLPPVSQPQNTYLPASESHQVTDSYLPPTKNTPSPTISYLPPDNSYLPPSSSGSHHQTPSTSYGSPSYNTITYSSPSGSISSSSSAHHKH